MPSSKKQYQNIKVKDKSTGHIQGNMAFNTDERGYCSRVIEYFLYILNFILAFF